MFARHLKVLVATALVAQPTSAQAHRRVEFAPALGAYMPTGSMEILLGCGSPVLCEFPSFQQARTVAVGGRVTTWLGKRGAIEGSFWYAPSGVIVTTLYTTAAQSVLERDGHMVLASLRGVLNVVPKVGNISLLLMGGPAVVRRAGGAWDEVARTTSTGGMLGVGLDIHSERGVTFRAAIEDYMYSFDSNDLLLIPSAFHHDFVFLLSVGHRLFGQRGERR